MSIFYQNRSEHFFLFESNDNTYGSHLHRQVEGIFVLSGALVVTVGTENRELKEGEFFLIFPNQMHSLSTTEHSRILLFLFNAGLCPAFEQYFYSSLPEFMPLSLSSLSSHGYLAWEQLQKLWLGHSKKVELVDPSQISYQNLLTESYMQILLADIFSMLSLGARTPTTSPELSARILLYIESHYMENLTLDQLAKQFHASRFTISRIFSEKLHTSFSAYLNGWRLEHARKLLLGSSLSVTEIAYESGFTSMRTFFRTFREKFGMSPKQYQSSH